MSEKVSASGPSPLFSAARKADGKAPLKGDAFAPPLRILQQMGGNRNCSAAPRFILPDAKRVSLPVCRHFMDGSDGARQKPPAKRWQHGSYGRMAPGSPTRAVALLCLVFFQSAGCFQRGARKHPSLACFSFATSFRTREKKWRVPRRHSGETAPAQVKTTK